VLSLANGAVNVVQAASLAAHASGRAYVLEKGEGMAKEAVVGRLQWYGRRCYTCATMTRADETHLVENLRLTFALHEAGVDMMRQNLRRRWPQMPDDEIEARLLVWLRERPGAELGDAPGKVVSWPRPDR
jgi:Rv0078B-related antitoxin